jgi:hypothetical protein
MAGGLAVHVADEASTGFLALWNPTVASLRDRFNWLPLPTFRYGEWLGGLVVLIIVLLAVSVLVFRGVRQMRPLSYALASVMMLNGLGHIAASVRLNTPVPGVYSAPPLLATAVFLFVSARRYGQAADRVIGSP